MGALRPTSGIGRGWRMTEELGEAKTVTGRALRDGSEKGAMSG